MAIRLITIEFNEYMGQVQLRCNGANPVCYDLDYKSELGQIVQEYFDEVRGAK